jgi:hypothetical protein
LLYFWYVNYALTEFIAFTVTMQLSFLTWWTVWKCS